MADVFTQTEANKTFMKIPKRWRKEYSIVHLEQEEMIGTIEEVEVDEEERVLHKGNEVEYMYETIFERMKEIDYMGNIDLYKSKDSELAVYENNLLFLLTECNLKAQDMYHFIQEDIKLNVIQFFRWAYRVRELRRERVSLRTKLYEVRAFRMMTPKEIKQGEFTKRMEEYLNTPYKCRRYSYDYIYSMISAKKEEFK